MCAHADVLMQMCSCRCGRCRCGRCSGVWRHTANGMAAGAVPCAHACSSTAGQHVDLPACPCGLLSRCIWHPSPGTAGAHVSHSCDMRGCTTSAWMYNQCSEVLQQSCRSPIIAPMTMLTTSFMRAPAPTAPSSSDFLPMRPKAGRDSWYRPSSPSSGASVSAPGMSAAAPAGAGASCLLPCAGSAAACKHHRCAAVLRTALQAVLITLVGSRGSSWQ
jgi:hypothetical protein